MFHVRGVTAFRHKSRREQLRAVNMPEMPDQQSMITSNNLHHFNHGELKKQGFLSVGSGVSGGGEGARYGLSLMPGGWPLIKNIFQSISEKAGKDPCCKWVGGGI